jgi:TRAP-type C4-dicarboxylate transport system substrate-binding protein
MEIRVAGTSADVLKNLGGSPVAMPQSDTPEALQKGVVKGNFSSLEVLKDFNYAAYTPYVTLINLQVVSFAVVMNKEKWNALPADVKKIFDDMRREQAEWTGTYVDNHVSEALKWSKEKYKDFQIFDLPKAESAEVPKLMQPIIDAYVKKANAAGLPGNQIMKDIDSLQTKYEKVYK